MEDGRRTYDGPVSLDRYGRRVPKPVSGSIALPEPTSATSRICEAVDGLFRSIVDGRLLVRRLNVVAADLLTFDRLDDHRSEGSRYVQPDLFETLTLDDPSENIAPDGGSMSEAERSGKSKDEKSELQMQRTLLDIKRKFGRNSIIKAMDMFDDATGQQRNHQIGGHAA